MVKKEKKQVYLRWGILAVIILLVSLLQNTGENEDLVRAGTINELQVR